MKERTYNTSILKVANILMTISNIFCVLVFVAPIVFFIIGLIDAKGESKLCKEEYTNEVKEYKEEMQKYTEAISEYKKDSLAWANASGSIKKKTQYLKDKELYSPYYREDSIETFFEIAKPDYYDYWNTIIAPREPFKPHGALYYMDFELVWESAVIAFALQILFWLQGIFVGGFGKIVRKNEY